MKLCPSDEHAICSQYSVTKERKIEIVTMSQGDIWQIFSSQIQLIFILEGKLNTLAKKIHSKNVQTGEMVLIPLHYDCTITALENVRMMVMTLDFNIIFCERMHLELLLETPIKTKKNADTGIGLLKLDQKIMDFGNTISENIANDDLKCSYYYDLKIREMLFLLWIYHDKKHIFNFFQPIYNYDFSFSSHVYQHLTEVKTVGELAEKLEYSLSGFEKKFRRIFETSPYQWMQEQRAKRIYKEIVSTRKTFTVIAKECDFSSPAHFNDFCRQYFQNTPGGLRKENAKRLPF